MLNKFIYNNGETGITILFTLLMLTLFQPLFFFNVGSEEIQHVLKKIIDDTVDTMPPSILKKIKFVIPQFSYDTKNKYEYNKSLIMDVLMITLLIGVVFVVWTYYSVLLGAINISTLTAQLGFILLGFLTEVYLYVFVFSKYEYVRNFEFIYNIFDNVNNRLMFEQK